VSNTFYPALQKSNCHLHDENDGIVKFTNTGMRFNGSGEVSADVVIFATGFDAVDSMVSYKVVGKNNYELAKVWQDYPRAYLGTSVPNFPNFFLWLRDQIQGLVILAQYL
jgi:cation diffusion facilitator CzcD-associated flavoprotein CzcO